MYGTNDSLDSDSICFGCRARTELENLFNMPSLKILDLEKNLEGMKTHIIEIKETAEDKLKMELARNGKQTSSEIG